MIKIIYLNLIVLLVFICFSCDNHLISDISDDIENSGTTYLPEIRISISVLDTFIDVSSGDILSIPDTYTEMVRTIVMEVFNDGNGDLHLTSSNIIEFASTDDFNLIAPYPSLPVKPGSSEMLYVSFTPVEAGNKSVSISIPNNDTDEKLFQITLEADILVNPSPETPVNVRADDGIDISGIEIQWDGVPEADLHVLYREETSTPPADVNSYLELVSGTSYSDKSAVPGRQYYYWVRAWSSDTGFGPISAYDPGYRKLSVPSLTLYTGASDSTSTVSTDIDWEDTTGDVTQYYIFRNTAPQISGAAEFNSSVSDYSDIGGVQGRNYYYAVKAYSSGTDSYSDLSIWEEGSRRLEPPVLNSVGNGTATDYIALGWTFPAGDIDLYLVTRRESAGTGFGLGFSTSEVTYHDQTAFPGRVLYYTVKAYSADTDSFSEESNELTGYRKIAGAPWYFEASQGERATGVNDGPFFYDPDFDSRIYISWYNRYTDVWNNPYYQGYGDCYRVYRSTSVNGVYTLVSGDIVPTDLIVEFTDYPPNDGVIYYYKVQVYSASSNTWSNLSDSTITSGFAILDGVQNLSVENHVSGGVLVTFDTVPNAERYYIYRKEESYLSIGLEKYEIVDYTTDGSYHDLTAPWHTTCFYHVRTWSSDPLHYGYFAENGSQMIYNE